MRLRGASIDGEPQASHEGIFRERVCDNIASLPGVSIFWAQKATNRFDVPGWDLRGNQRFQYGDVRIETPTKTVIIEAETAGGVTNLVKYWPLLAAGPPVKHLLLMHVFRVAPGNDYVSHQRLWDFTVDRMREHLAAQHHVRWRDHWEAKRHTYRAEPGSACVEDMERITRLVEAAVRM